MDAYLVASDRLGQQCLDVPLLKLARKMQLDLTVNKHWRKVNLCGMLAVNRQLSKEATEEKGKAAREQALETEGSEECQGRVRRG